MRLHFHLSSAIGVLSLWFSGVTLPPFDSYQLSYKPGVVSNCLVYQYVYNLCVGSRGVSVLLAKTHLSVFELIGFIIY